MSTEIEIEVKALLNYKAYMKICRHFNLLNTTPIIQTNYYLDTPDYQLTKMKAALRIRNIKNSYTLTLKTLLTEGRLEVNEDITVSMFNNIIENDFLKKGEVYDKLVELGIPTKEIKYFNCLTTKRYQFTYNDPANGSGKLCLDYNTYGDYADYELEFEGSTIELSKKIVQKLLDDIGIPFAFTELSKIERVFNTTIK